MQVHRMEQDLTAETMTAKHQHTVTENVPLTPLHGNDGMPALTEGGYSIVLEPLSHS